jgi:hypothetical protein
MITRKPRPFASGRQQSDYLRPRCKKPWSLDRVGARHPVGAIAVALIVNLSVLLVSTGWLSPPNPWPILPQAVDAIVPSAGGAASSADAGRPMPSSTLVQSEIVAGECEERFDFGTTCPPSTDPVSNSGGRVLQGWVNLRPRDSPASNASGSEEAVYDPAAGATIMLQTYCGSGPCISPLTWSFSNKTWTLLHPASSPEARYAASMVYDPALQSVLLFGGASWTNSTVYSDTWEFSEDNWTNITGGSSPGPLYGSAMVYDSYDGYVLLFGGDNQTGGTPNETWEYVGGSWSAVVTSGHAPPDLGNYAFQTPSPMTYDSKMASVVLFEHSNWTYFYQNLVWTAVFAPIPIDLQAGGGSLAFDPLTGFAVYVAGTDGDWNQFTNWSWGFNGTGWVQLHTNGGPPPVAYSCLVFDPIESSLLFFGGENLSQAGGSWLSWNETWLFGSAEVLFESSPANGGSTDLGGVAYSNGTNASIGFGTYRPFLVPTAGFQGTNLSVSSNFTLYNGSYDLTGNATVSGEFLAPPLLTLVSEPSQCELDFNGTAYISGSTPFFEPGSFSLSAPACHGLLFDHWLSTQNASVADPDSNRTSVALSGPTAVTAVFLASLTFQVVPAFAGEIIFNGSQALLNSPQEWIAQTYSLRGLPTQGWRLTGFTLSGGESLASGRVTVNSSGSIQANFILYPTVTFSTSPKSCPTIQFNRSSYPSGAGSGFLVGSYPISAPTCSDALFENWSVSGGVAVASAKSVNTTAGVTGNGTLTADYTPAAWVNLTVQPSAAAGSIIWNGTPVRNGSYFETLTGNYGATADPANGWHFVTWETQGGLRLVPGSFALSSNGSLTADFQANASSPGGNQTGTGAFAPTVWEWAAIGAILIGAVAMVLVVIRRRRSVVRQGDDI